MRNLVLCFLLTCAAVFGQSASDNAAADALKQRMQGLKLLNPLNLQTPKPVFAPKVCSIPLLNVIPPGTRDKMPVIKPEGGVLKGDTVQVPAPPCAAGIFTNAK